MRLRFAALTTFVGCAIALACGSFDTDPSTTAGEDGGAEANEATTSADVAVPLDASVDGPVFCASIDAAFCWSFDELVPGHTYAYGARMVGVGPSGPHASLKLVEGAPDSAPYALELLIDNDGGPAATNNEFVGASHVLPGSARTFLSCELDLYVDPGAGTASTFNMLTNESDQTLGIAFTLSSSAPSQLLATLGFADNNVYSPSPSVPVPQKQWFHAKLDVTNIGAANGAYVATIAGNTTTHAAGDAGFRPIVAIRPMLGTYGDTKKWLVRYDNIVCRYDN